MASLSAAAPDQRPASSFQDHVIRQTFPAAHPWLAVGILVAAVVLAYRGVWQAGFIWDDDIYLTHNPCIVGPQSFVDIWTSRHARICPLVISSFWLQFQIWGMRALPYHLVNVAFHAGTAVALWRTLQVLGVRGAWLGAALWAVHPVQVESVAWISELKNTQSGFFFVLCVYFYARWEKGDAVSRKHYLLAILFGAAAMASKSSAVVLPPVLLLCSWWLTGRLPLKRWLTILPFGLLAVATVALSVWSQNLEGANEPEWARSGPERLITAANVIWFYLGKLAWPEPLIFIYPRWTLNASAWSEWLPVVAGALLVSVLVVLRRAWTRAALFAGGVFVIALLPVAGLVDHYFLRYSFVGDHFQYLASMGPLALAGAGLTTLGNVLGRKSWDVLSLLCGAWVVILGYVSAAHVPVFDDDVKLWTDTLQRNPDCWLAANNLGVAYMAGGSPELARRLYEQVLQRDVQAHLAPASAPGNGALPAPVKGSGRSLSQESSLFNNLGLAETSLGQLPKAMESFRKALALSPANGEAHLNLANGLLKTNRFPEAVAEYRQSMLTLMPKASTYQSLASALQSAGDLDAALENFRKALALEPDSALLRYNLGNALAQAGRMGEAVDAYDQALKRAPDFTEAVHNLAWVLATTADDAVRNGQRAEEVLKRSLDLPGGREPLMLRTLAAAQFEVGQKESAIQTAQNALLLATAGGGAGLAEALKTDLESYRQGKPVRIALGRPVPPARPEKK